MIRLNDYTHIAPSPLKPGWFTLFNTDECECCGIEAMGESTPHLRGPTLLADALGAGLTLVKSLPVELGWSDEFGGAVCDDCHADHMIDHVA